MLTRAARVLSYENRVVLILATVGGVTNMDILAFNFLSPFIASDLHLSNGEIGLIGAAGLLAWAVSAILSSLWSDRSERRRAFLVWALLCFALFSTATALATSFVTLITARWLVGLAEGPVVPMQNSITHAASSPRRRGVNIGIVQNFGSTLLGGLAGPLMLISLAAAVGWRDAFLIAAAPALMIALVVRFCIREPTRAPALTPRPPVLLTIRTIVSVRNIRLCFAIGTCAVGWLATVTTFVPLWLIRHLHFAPRAMGVAMACFGAAGTIAAILVPGLSDKIGRRPALVGFAFAGVLVPLGMLFGSASMATICLSMFAGSFFSGIMPLFIGIIPLESIDARQGATALAIVMGCAQIAGSLLGPVLGGALADRFSLAAPFWLAMGLALGAALIGLTLTETAPRRTT